MGNNIYINYSKIFDTEKNLNILENIVGGTDFSVHFDDMETYLRGLNLEHDFCLYYKDFLEIIYQELGTIRNGIFGLNASLHQSVLSFINKEELTATKLNRLNDIYPEAHLFDVFGSSLTASSNEINTVPIGIAIGAAGILGSAGAVVADSIMHPSKSSQKKQTIDTLEEYKGDLEEFNNDDLEDYSALPEYQEVPYSANRDYRASDHVYGDKWDSKDDDEETYKPALKEVEPNKMIDLSLEGEDEEDQSDDFY